MNKPLAIIENLTKRFRKGLPPAIDRLHISLSPGKMIGLVGPDGAGKTTLIRLMTGLLLPSEGKIEILGYDTRNESHHIHELISYMPQKFGLYEDISLLQNLNLYADLQSIPKKEREALFSRLLSFTGLAPFRQRLAGNLSGGMKQKLGICCALLRRPRLLLLDEPSVGVDPSSRVELWKIVTELTKTGISVLWSTSYLDEAERCHEVILLNKGKLLYFGPPSQLTEGLSKRTFHLHPIHTNKRRILAQILQDPKVSDGTIQGDGIRLVLRKPNELGEVLPSLMKRENVSLKEVAPRFEDAFIDILGGGPGGFSPLAQLFPSISDQSITEVVKADHLTKKFGSFTAVDRISFSVKRGEIFGLLGPNGAGKSTTFKMLCGLLTTSEGKAYVIGKHLEQAPRETKSRIGYMAQKFSLYGLMTSLQNLEFFAGIYLQQEPLKRKRIQEMVEIFELQPYLSALTSELPLGFKQRLALSCALMHYPEVLFLDEPTSGVDPITRREFWNHINSVAEKGVSIVITTHFMDEAEYCDRIALVNQGKIITIGTPEELKNKVRSSSLPSPTLDDAFIFLSSNNGVVDAL